MFPTLNEILSFDQTHNIQDVIKNYDEASVHAMGCVARVGEWSSRNLRLSYSNGIFPWPHEGSEDLWFCPVLRGVIDFKSLHIPQRLLRQIKKTNYEVKFNHSFSEVIKHCQTQVRKNQTGSWIKEDLIQAYIDLHREGMCHSVEVWEEGELISGLYGVGIAGYFSAESVFSKKSNYAKYALLETIKTLQAQGLEWMDVQMLTNLSRNFGAYSISRSEFLRRVQESAWQPTSPLIV